MSTSNDLPLVVKGICHLLGLLDLDDDLVCLAVTDESRESRTNLPNGETASLGDGVRKSGGSRQSREHDLTAVCGLTLRLGIGGLPLLVAVVESDKQFARLEDDFLINIATDNGLIELTSSH